MRSLLQSAVETALLLSLVAGMLWKRGSRDSQQPLEAADIQFYYVTLLEIMPIFSTLSALDQSAANNIYPLQEFYDKTHLPSEAPWVIGDAALPDDWPSAGQIEFTGYSMRYADSQTLALEDISFTVRPGEKIGIVGRTGAGKSSLLQALFRIVEPEAGSIFVDGVNIHELGLHDLRARMSVVPQNPALFEGTLRSNLDPLSRHTDDEAWAAIKAAQIEGLAGVGLDMWIERGGRNLSAGQCQLICLCRALLQRRKILVLDEATANVDAATDQIIKAAVKQRFSSSTVLTIAHRVETVIDSDRILVMDEGRVAEFDTPESLLSRGSRFAELLAASQASSPAQEQ
ncbi:P-loop containing nucleoside triphosphate hydrolase protein [Martensiomyces pterosporus]|nr:P-loop containing nucleoside triphosphate hydrolase protein [Martensiomyces pterosporus]